MLEGLTLAQPLPISGPPPPPQPEEEGEEALDFAELMDDTEAEHPDPPQPDPLIAYPALSPPPLPQDIAQDPDVAGAPALRDKAQPPTVAANTPPPPSIPAETSDHGAIDEGADQASPTRQSGESGLWRMVQNLRSAHTDPTQPDPPLAEAGPTIALPLAGADTISSGELPDLTLFMAAPETSEPSALPPRNLPDQILTGLRPHLLHIAPQMALAADQSVQTHQSVQTQGPDRIEIRLDPEELGRVQFTLQPDGDSLRVIIAVERPETLDLLRRHADLLTQSLRDAGYGGASLSFSTSEDSDAGSPSHQPPMTGQPEPPAPPPTTAQIAAESGLNLLF